MRVVRGFRELDLDLDRPAATVGNFDGVHRGHQQVMRHAVTAAAERGTLSVVCTFAPHTMQVLRPERAPLLLQTLEQRLAAIDDLGIDLAVVIPFSPEIAATGRRTFVDGFLCGELGVGSLHVSKGFSFGRGRSGKTEYLEERASEMGFAVARVDARELESEHVSSTRIRDAVTSGDVQLAQHLLGRPFALSGKVVTGSGRGHSLGAPTANLLPDNDCRPAAGVYAGFVRGADLHLPAVMNIGHRPTFESEGALCFEAHLLDFEGDLYEQRLEFDFIARVRDERRFATPEELAAQIQSDVAVARERLRQVVS